MSALLSKLSTGGGRKSTTLGGPPAPQVNLLPASVGDAKRDARLRKMLLAGLAGVIVLAGIFYYFAMLSEASAQEELDAANQQTSVLMKEKASLAYVPLVINQLGEAKLAEMLTMGGEVNWRGYIGAVTAILPPNTAVTDVVAASNAVGVPLPANVNVLAAPRVATITFTTRTASVPDTSAWLVALSTVQGFQDAFFTTAALTDDNGTIFYEVTTVVEIDDTGLSNRLNTIEPVATEDEAN